MSVQVGLSLGLVVGSLAAGWWLHRRRILTEVTATRIVRFIVKGPSPVVLCLTVWQMNLRSLTPWLLPLVGLVVSVTSLLPAMIYVRRAKLSNPQVGSFLTCAFFSNLGYFGAFLAFALFGDVAYGLCMLYLAFYNPCFYTVGFGMAAHYGRGKQRAGEREALHDDLRLYPFLGMIVGVVVSLSGIARPAWGSGLTHVLIPLDTALYLMAAGSQLTFAWPGRWLPACWVMSAIKFLYCPLIGWVLVSILHVTGLARTVVLLEASTPVAVSPLVLPLLFGLDKDLSNALWLVTTMLAIPYVLLLIPLLPAF